jgi:WD40 repeat protein
MILILDLATEKILGSLHTPGTADAAWRPDTERIVTACDDFLVYEWDAMSGRRLAVLRGHQAEAMGVTISGPGDLVATRSWDETLRIWEPQTGAELLQIPGRFAYHQLNRDGQRLGFRAADRVGVYEIAPRCWHSLREQNTVGKGPWEVNFDPQGQRIVSASDDGARIWDSDSGCELALLPMNSCMSASFSNDGEELYTCNPEGLRCWPLIPSEDHRTLQFGSPTALQGAIQSDSPRARVSWNQDVLAAVTGPDVVTIFPWGEPLQHNQQRIVLQGHMNVGSVALSPDGRWAATGQWGGQGLIVWDARTGDRLRNLVTEPGSTQVAFSPDNKWLAGGTKDEYRLWEVGSWRLHFQVPHTSALAPLAFSADGHLLAIASTRSNIELRDPHTGAKLCTLESPVYGFLSSLSFSPDGGKLAAASLDHTVQIWNLRELRHRLSQLGLGLGQ